MELIEYERLRAIHFSNRMAVKIARDLPEIADDYRNGDSLTKLSEKYFLASTYSLTESIARTALCRALILLIDDKEERKKLNLQHKTDCGYSNFVHGKGLFGLNEERKKEASRKAGNTTFKRRRGIHNLSLEERSRLGKLHYPLGLGKMSKEKRATMSRNSVISRGYIPWEDGERLYFVTLYKNPDFFHKSGSYKGCPNYRAISVELSRVYGTNRSPATLKIWKRIFEKQNFNENVFL